MVQSQLLNLPDATQGCHRQGDVLNMQFNMIKIQYIKILHNNQTVFNAQSALGCWNPFLRGYLTPQWDLLHGANSNWKTKMLEIIS